MASKDVEKSSLDVRMSKLDRVYRPKEKVDGVVVVNSFKGWSHSGVMMSIEGLIHLNTVGKGIAMPADLAVKPIQIVRIDKEICPPGKFNDGTFELPFEFMLKALDGQQLVESYHGVYISIVYTIVVSCDRGVMKKGLRRDMEFIVELPSAGGAVDPLPVPFNISPDSLENVSAQVLATIPRFKINGKLHKSKCPITQPLTGEMVVDESFSPIRSIELQLVRVETVTLTSRTVREATEIQNIQIGDGNVCRGLSIPLYMVFPRLFSCPTYSCSNFKIEFEVNLVVVFGDGYMITENFPIMLYRE
jgi:hypothetical protein